VNALCICPICGKYELGSVKKRELFDKKELKQKMACYLFYDKLFNSRCEDCKFAYVIIQSGLAEVEKENGEYEERYKKENRHILLDAEVENWYPKTISEKVNKILLALNKLSKFEGDYVDVPYQVLSSLFVLNEQLISQNGFPPQSKQLDFYLNFLKEKAFIDWVTYPSSKITMGHKDGLIFQILPKGYDEIYDLQKNNFYGKKVFIAMSFDPNHLSTLEPIKSAIIESGYIPNVILEKPHNNWIMSEILYEIKDSKFLIADLTGYKAGVYYEAGYAEALGKQVILTCQAGEEFEKVHFDLRQKFIIVWNDYDELKEKLKAQIKGAVGTAS